jgi:hypothetical protein
MLREQCDARSSPVSNYNDMKYSERKHVNTLPPSYRYRGVNSHQIPKTRVKFEPKTERPNGYEKSGKEVPKKKEFYQLSESATSDTEVESVLDCQYEYMDDKSEHESLFDDHNDYSYGRTLSEMESKMNATTNQYFRKIKSTLSETCSKLKVQQKHKPRGKASPDERNDKAAGGDFKSAQDQHEDAYIDKILKLKTNCYKKIDQNLKILQQIDQINDKLYKNLIASGSKNN